MTPLRDTLQTYMKHLSDDLHAYLTSDDPDTALQVIAEHYELSEEETGHLSNEVYTVLLGISQVADLADNLGAGIDRDDDTLAALIDEIDEQIIQPVADEVPFADLDDEGLKPAETPDAESPNTARDRARDALTQSKPISKTDTKEQTETPITAEKHSEHTLRTSATSHTPQPKTQSSKEELASTPIGGFDSVKENDEKDEASLRRDEILRELEGNESANDPSSKETSTEQSNDVNTKDNDTNTQTNDPSQRYEGEDPYREPID